MRYSGRPSRNKRDAKEDACRLLAALAAVALGRLTVALAAFAASAAAAAVSASALAPHGSLRPHLAGPKKKGTGFRDIRARHASAERSGLGLPWPRAWQNQSLGSGDPARPSPGPMTRKWKQGKGGKEGGTHPPSPSASPPGGGRGSESPRRQPAECWHRGRRVPQGSGQPAGDRQTERQDGSRQATGRQQRAGRDSEQHGTRDTGRHAAREPSKQEQH